MKISRILLVGLLCVVLLITGCGKEISTDEFKISDSENTEDSRNEQQETIGVVLHGANWSEEEEEYSFIYNGGQLEIPYMMNGSGICTSIGFLIYMDGIPQPYMIKGVDEEYKYMHVIEGEENTDKEFVISFIPVTGKVGDKLTLSINSIANPSFIPDMVSTFSYGMSHKSLEAVYDITFQKEDECVLEAADELSIMSNVSNKQTDIDKEEKTYIQDKSLESELDLDTSVYSDLIIDDHSMFIDSKLDISDKDVVHVKYIMMGHPGIKYRVSFYLNHQLLADKTKNMQEFELATGKMNTIEFDLDVSDYEEGSLYAMAVPVNAMDYPKDGIQTKKYQSIHLYRGEKASVLEGNSGDTKRKDETENVSKTEERKQSNAKIEKLKAVVASLEDIKKIEYVSEDKVLIVSDKMYLIDVSSGEIVAQNAECDYVNGEIKVYGNEKNIIILGKKYKNTGEDVVFLDDEDSPKICVVYYDHQLNLLNSVNIHETFGLNPNFVQNVAVGKSGKLAVYEDENKQLYLCDTDTKKKKKILGDSDKELIYKDIQCIGFCGIEFIQNDEKIAFLAECLDYPVDSDSENYYGMGSVSLDKGEYKVSKIGKEYSELAVFDSYAVLSQDCGFTNPTGKVNKYIFDINRAEDIKLETSGESESVYCSKSGNILATSEKNGYNSWNIRLYDAKSGELIMDKLYDELPSGNYREPQIYVFEKLNISLLFFRTEDENSKDTFGIVQYNY